MKALTARQKKIFEWMVSFRLQHGIPPTHSEIGRRFGIRPSSVFGHLTLMEKKGYIKRGKLGARSLKLIAAGPMTIPEVRRLAAGPQLFAPENILGYIPFDRAILGAVPDGRYFILRASGYSMAGDGILDGDGLVIRCQDEAQEGQLVVALLLNGNAIVRRVRHEGGRVRLQPASCGRDLTPVEDAVIQGLVVALFRTYD